MPQTASVTIELEEAEKYVKPLLPILNNLQGPAAKSELRMASGRCAQIDALGSFVIDLGWEWSRFSIKCGESYRLELQICGGAGDLSVSTHFPVILVSGLVDAALEDLRALGSDA